MTFGAKALPDFHVGGVGIEARAYLSQAKILDLNRKENFKFDSRLFVDACSEYKATLTALVPTQVYEIVKSQIVLAAIPCELQ